MPSLDDVIPTAHFSERHQRRIAAPAASVWDALHELRLGDLTLSRTLMGIRTLPGRVGGKGPPRMVSGRFLEDGPVPVLITDPGRAVIAGGVMQPWKLRGGDAPPRLDATALRGFDQPGWVKVGLDFVLYPDRGGTLLTTETRVLATDPGTHARFRLYWLVIRAGSGLIRHDMLRAVERRARRDPHAPDELGGPKMF